MKMKKNKSCEKEFEGYNDFYSKIYGHGKDSKNIKGWCPAVTQGVGVGVKNYVYNQTLIWAHRLKPITLQT